MIDLASLPRIAPSKIRRPKPERAPVDLATAQLPLPATRWRKTIDGPLLTLIAWAAADAHEAAMLPEADRAAAVAALAQDLATRYPRAEMAVLAKYGHARPIRHVYVTLPQAGYRLPGSWQASLPRPLVLQPGTQSFDLDADGRLNVPDGARAYFTRLCDLRTRREQDFTGAPAWAARNHPARWAEIEAAFPLIAAWLEREREARG